MSHPRPCSNCGLPITGSRQGKECSTCSRYRNRTGEPRPEYLVSKGVARILNPARRRNHNPTVYVFRDHDGAALYVGMTTRGSLRFVQHASQCPPWWKQVATIAVTHCSSNAEAAQIEAALIDDLKPPFNRVEPKPPGQLIIPSAATLRV